MLRTVLGLALPAILGSGCRAPEPSAPRVPVKSPSPKPPRAGPEVRVETFAGRRFTVCRVNLSVQSLELFWKDDAGRPVGGFAALEAWLRARGRRLLFAANAGMYMEDLAPVGLYVENGEQLRPLNLRRGDGSNFCLLPNGVFALTDAGARVVESTEYKTIRAQTRLATQSGPMLVIDGKLHPKFGRNSTSRLVRNGVGVPSPDQVVFALAEDPLNFHEFATFFRDGLGCDDALYLDGSISGLYAPSLSRNDSHAPYGPILAVVGEP